MARQPARSGKCVQEAFFQKREKGNKLKAATPRDKLINFTSSFHSMFLDASKNPPLATSIFLVPLHILTVFTLQLHLSVVC